MGFLLGDMLGSPFEGFGYQAAVRGYMKKIGSYTDDTLMYLSVLKSLKKSKDLSKCWQIIGAKRELSNYAIR